ncbi:hypothetical protein PFICI_06209 [Pestalotiopsis fici W106-1]|uniref:ML-like domain-containing protein n=1 Tax=Pestalotiopsis fici (strain W106-1 / CGMCC3.15140) TaxID=1229662 RepID=W3X735_PESFW|nr:uncharacterized protein PFICI_06209 [Pestalotiopsis fici W106-1]ETS81207.1 hypothetical protein PFICI_06209 [Pestalotiopsis fici W106-1]
MRFSTAGFALCAIQAVASFAIEPRQALTCTPGNKVATYDDLTPLPIDDGNTGLTSASLNPYKDLNYTRFSVITKTDTDNALFYTLSKITAGTLGALQTALNNILGSTGLPLQLPPLLEAPRIVGSTARTQYRLQSFQFGCSLRAGGAATVIPIPCTVTVRPVEPARLLAGQSYNCTYNEGPASRLENGGAGPPLATCTPPTGSLLAGQGFTFQTTPKLLDTSTLGPLQTIVDTALELLVVSVFDNFTYREYCI